jgi:hypothetical protein
MMWDGKREIEMEVVCAFPPIGLRYGVLRYRSALHDYTGFELVVESVGISEEIR